MTIDVAVLRRLQADVGGDALVMTELVQTFLDQGPKLVSDATRAASTGDAFTLFRAAHTLKSTAATFGAKRLAELCRTLEADASVGLPARAAERAAEIAAEFAQARDALAAWRLAAARQGSG